MKETRNYLLGTEPTETKVFRINNFEPKLPESLNSFTEDDADFVLVFTVDKDDEEYGKKMKASFPRRTAARTRRNSRNKESRSKPSELVTVQIRNSSLCMVCLI